MDLFCYFFNARLCKFSLFLCQAQQLRDFLRIVAPSKTSYEMRPALGSVLTAGRGPGTPSSVFCGMMPGGNLASVSASCQAF